VLDGEFMHLEYANLPLGLWEDYTFTGESLDDFRDKQLLVYTDGLNEAEDRDHKELGNDAVLNIMKENAANTSREVIDSLIASVEAHRNGADPNDDLTLLCLKLLVNND
jgi:sigma-B regulation protein RsbU (phosphoserine phosphatase)